MPLTSRPRYAPGDTITSAWANILDDDLSFLDVRTGGDPGGAGKFPESNGALGAAWIAPSVNDTLAPSADAGALSLLVSNLANRIKAITGAAGWMSAPGSTIAALITSIAAKLPLAGGSLTGDLEVTRSGSGQPTQGVLYLGGAANGHWIAVLDGTNLLYSNNKIWHEGNDGPTSGLAAQTAASATTATSAATATTATTANGVAAGSVTDVGIAAANKDGAAGTPSMHTLGTGAQQAAPGNHAHTSMAKVATGSYAGNSSTRAVTGLGFAPKTVFVMNGTTGAVGGIIQNGIIIGWAGSNVTGTATMDGDGFTITSGATGGINTTGNTYAYVALG